MRQGELFPDDRYEPIKDHNQGTTGTRRRLVLRLLSDYRWHLTSEIEAASTGGSQGTRRLRELRRLGYVIEMRRVENSTQYAYRLIGKVNHQDGMEVPRTDAGAMDGSKENAK